jgi:hypothetical protein
MEIIGFWNLPSNLFLPVFPPIDVLPLRARLGLAHPTGLHTLHAHKVLTGFRLALATMNRQI